MIKSKNFFKFVVLTQVFASRRMFFLKQSEDLKYSMFWLQRQVGCSTSLILLQFYFLAALFITCFSLLYTKFARYEIY